MFISINGEPLITENRIAIQKDWSRINTISSILDSKVCFSEISMIQWDKNPLLLEYEELEKTLTDFADTYFNGRLGAIRGTLAKNIKRNNHYNIYGRIITKTRKGVLYILQFT